MLDGAGHLATMGHHENMAGASGRGQRSVKDHAATIFNFEGHMSCPNYPALLFVIEGKQPQTRRKPTSVAVPVKLYAPRNLDCLPLLRVMNYILLRICVFQTFET